MGKTYVRAITGSDLPTLLKWRHNPNVIDNLLGPSFFVAIEQEQRWLERTQNDKTAIKLAICESGSDQYIGNIYATGIDAINRSAEVHIFIGDDQARGKGYARDALQQFVEYLFNQMNLERLEARIFEDNARSLALFEKCGFVKEGTQREAVYKNGKRRNVCVLGLLRREWKAS